MSRYKPLLSVVLSLETSNWAKYRGVGLCNCRGTRLVICSRDMGEKGQVGRGQWGRECAPNPASRQGKVVVVVRAREGSRGRHQQEPCQSLATGQRQPGSSIVQDDLRLPPVHLASQTHSDCSKNNVHCCVRLSLSVGLESRMFLLCNHGFFRNLVNVDEV